MILRKEISIDFLVPKTLIHYISISVQIWKEEGDDIDYSFAIEDVQDLTKEFMLRNVITQASAIEFCHDVVQKANVKNGGLLASIHIAVACIHQMYPRQELTYTE